MRTELLSKQIKEQAEFKIFAQEFIKPYADDCDKKEKIDPKIIEALASKGYLGSMLPAEYGGMDLDSVSIGLLNEEIGKVCSSSRSLLTVHGMVSLAIYRWGTKEQKEYWLPRMCKGEVIGAFGLTEPNVGSDAKSIEATAEVIDGQYALNGKKKWITMGQIADIFLIIAQCNNKPTAFLVEKNTPGFSIKPITGLIGARASMLAEISMENCCIPIENIVGLEGTGLSHIAMSSLDYGRYTIAWGCVGLAQACLDECIKYGRNRKQFGSYLRQHQLIQKMITEMVVNIKAARLMCINAGYLRDSGDPDSIMETWNAKYFSSKIVNQVAGDALQIHGANGCSDKFPIERYYRDAKINEIIEGTSQMHEVLIATYTFRNYSRD